MTDTSKETKTPWFLIMLIVLFVVVLWLLNWWYLVDIEDRGTFGDMFGGINALFSGLAFAGVIYAILLQRRELELQRRELELNRSELAGQREALTAQNATMERQSFESTFFQLLRLHNEILAAMDFPARKQPTQVVTGRDCFSAFRSELARIWNKGLPEHMGSTELNRVNKTYLAFYNSRQADLGHYFRTLYNLIKFVDLSPVDDKRIYTNLIRAQLSSDELFLLFYNCLSDLGADRFKPLIEKYALFNNLNRETLIEPEKHSILYLSEAYGE